MSVEPASGRHPCSVQDHLPKGGVRATICIVFPRVCERVPEVFLADGGGGSRRAQEGVLGDRSVRDLSTGLRAAGRFPRAGARPLDALRPPPGPPVLPGRTPPRAGRLAAHPAGPGPGARERRRLRGGGRRRGLRLPLAHPAAWLAGPGRPRGGAAAAGPGRRAPAARTAPGHPGLRALAGPEPGRPAVDPDGDLAGAAELVRARR